ncbi:hypothetical protein [Paraburkholderia youngii]|uniref:hypothetical protein n=1 Tax=Paraburkholderia youngii TaxID=2782701 RepID=UPI003D206B7C
MKRTLQKLSLLCAALIGAHAAQAESAAQWLQVEIAYAGHSEVAAQGSVIDVGHSAHTEKLNWTGNAESRNSILSDLVASPSADYEVVVGRNVWKFPKKRASAEWSAWMKPNAESRGAYKVGSDPEGYSYELLRAQGRVLETDSVPVDSGYRIRYRTSDKSN